MISNSATSEKRSLSERISEAWDCAHDAMDSACENTTEVKETLNREIHESPIRSSLIAVGIGYVLGKLFLS